MVVGNNELTTTKNADELLAILMAMVMQQYDTRSIALMEHIQASLEATGRRHRASACVILPRQPPWSMIPNKTHKTLTKHNF
jgi:hypothetical protein